MNKNECKPECCNIPVCLNFLEVCATEDFKESMRELFSEIFCNLCSCTPVPDVTICHMPGTPAEKTMIVPQSALQAHLDHGDTLGACEELKPEPIIEVINNVEVLDPAEVVEPVILADSPVDPVVEAVEIAGATEESEVTESAETVSTE
jgi:hypothetical protein